MNNSNALISENVGREINELMRLFFEANAVCDTIANRMDVQFNLPAASEAFHLNIAHAYPGDSMADDCVGYLSKKMYKAFYGNIPLKDFEYSRLEDYFLELVNIQGRIEEQANKIAAVAEMEHDNSTLDFASAMLSGTIALFSKQAFILYNATKNMENPVSFNRQFASLLIVPIIS